MERVTPDAIVERLCRLPSDERRIRTPSTVVMASMYKLLECSGYLEAPETLTRENIMNVLQRNPQLVHDWWLWSGDQRPPEGWCFDESTDHSYRVYCYPQGESIVLSDRIGACAQYILHVIPWIAEWGLKKI